MTDIDAPILIGVWAAAGNGSEASPTPTTTTGASTLPRRRNEFIVMDFLLGCMIERMGPYRNGPFF